MLSAAFVGPPSFLRDSMTPSSQLRSVAGTTPGRPDPLLLFLVSAFGFLLASFPARNSDVWMHLAVGRQLAHGPSSSSTSPAFSLPPRPQQGWLYDLGSYGLYAFLGGPSLVLCKALLVAGLSLLLFRLSRAGGGWWVPAICTMLAVLTMSLRLPLQPVTISYLFLALVLWLLGPRLPVDNAAEGNAPVTWRPSVRAMLPPWSLAVLFVLWANLDSWFLVGLATVTLASLGLVLDETWTSRSSFLHCLSTSLIVSLPILAATCLLNPSGVAVFRPPWELGGVGPGGPGVVPSPFHKAYLAKAGLSPAGLAYFLLLGLGVLSFAANRPRWSWQRFLPWLGLALLSAVQVRAIPFFAVVAGLVLAWNLQEALARRQEVRVGRELRVALGLILVVCAWPGWLQSPPFEPRRWAVETPPSLERGAAVTRRWHEEGKLGTDSRGLHLSPDSAHAFAWFCPEAKGLLDDRLAAAVRSDPAAVQEGLRAAGINHVIVYDPDRDRRFVTLSRLFADPEQWPLLCVEGELAIFGWRDPEAKPAGVDPFLGWELDVGRLAYHPAADKKAPHEGPEREPEVRHWWDAFWKPAPPRPIDQEEATLHLVHAEALRGTSPLRHMAAWEGGQAAAFVGAAGGWLPPVGCCDASLRLVLLRPRLPGQNLRPDELPGLDRWVLGHLQGFRLQRDDTPPALLYLAVRAARRAVAANPDAAQAYLVLGDSYLRLLRDTRERAWSRRLAKLGELRRAQASAALNQAIALKPDFAQAHLLLGELYREMGYLDLALTHLRTYVQWAERTHLTPEVGLKELDHLAKEVEERTDSFDAGAAGLRVQDWAALAWRNGLAGKARDLLLKSDRAAFGEQGLRLELELLLYTGRAKAVADWTTPEQTVALGAARYHWLRTQALAASGAYASAEEECSELARSVLFEGQLQGTQLRETIALTVGRAVLDVCPGLGSAPLWRAFRWVEFRGGIANLARGMQQQADATVLRGLLLLEEGDADEAEVAFGVALALWGNESTAASGGGLDFAGRVVAEGCLVWLE